MNYNASKTKDFVKEIKPVVNLKTSFRELEQRGKNFSLIKNISKDAFKGLVAWKLGDFFSQREIDRFFDQALAGSIYDPTKITHALKELGESQGGEYMTDGVKTLAKLSGLYTFLFRLGFDVLEHTATEIIVRNRDAMIGLERTALLNCLDLLTEFSQRKPTVLSKYLILATCNDICQSLGVANLDRLKEYKHDASFDMLVLNHHFLPGQFTIIESLRLLVESLKFPKNMSMFDDPYNIDPDDIFLIYAFYYGEMMTAEEYQSFAMDPANYTAGLLNMLVTKENTNEQNLCSTSN
jgi:hypothetical protein